MTISIVCQSLETFIFPLIFHPFLHTQPHSTAKLKIVSFFSFQICFVSRFYVIVFIFLLQMIFFVYFFHILFFLFFPHQISFCINLELFIEDFFCCFHKTVKTFLYALLDVNNILLVSFYLLEFPLTHPSPQKILQSSPFTVIITTSPKFTDFCITSR